MKFKYGESYIGFTNYDELVIFVFRYFGFELVYSSAYGRTSLYGFKIDKDISKGNFIELKEFYEKQT